MNRFALRMLFGGGAATLFGLLWLGCGLTGSDLDGVLTGGLWKGPLLMVAGIGAVVMGIRMLREGDERPGDDARWGGN